MAILRDKFTYKSWIFMLRSKDKFFDIFKLWLSKVKACESKFNYLQIDDGEEFISTTLQTFCQKRKIKIGYTVPYIYKENGIAEQCWRIFA